MVSHGGLVAASSRVRATVVAAVLLGVIATQSSMAAPLPSLPTSDSATPRSGLQVRPFVIRYTGDGTGILGGGVRGLPGSALERRFGRIRWRAWNTTQARGSGVDWVDLCATSCAASPHKPYRVSIEAWNPKVLGGRLVFGRIRVTYVGRRPVFNGRPFRRSYSLPVVFASGRYSY